MDTKDTLRALATATAQLARVVEQLTREPQRKPPTRARVVVMKRAAA